MRLFMKGLRKVVMPFATAMPTSTCRRQAWQSGRSTRVLRCACLVVAVSCPFFAIPAGAAELAVIGSGTSEKIVSLLADEFNAIQSAHRVTVPANIGAPATFEAIRKGKAFFGRIARAPDEAEAREGFRCMPFARDAAVFVVGEKVKVGNLAQQQVADIYAGRIADWRAVGAEPAPIRAIGRQSTESVLRSLRAGLPAFRDVQFGPRVKIVQSDEQARDLLDTYGHGIAWGTLSNVALGKTGARPIALDGVVPSAANLANGKYKLATPYCFLYKGELREPVARSFLDFVFSSKGAEIIRKHGLLAVARQ
jgi:phosphate transport system substrate-binding protein